MDKLSDAENFSSVRLMVREKIGSQTDRHADNISIFFLMKKAIIIPFGVLLGVPEQ